MVILQPRPFIRTSQCSYRIIKLGECLVNRNIINEYQTTTVLLQRSRLAPFFHPLFIYPHHFSGWPTGWFSKIKGTVIDKDKYFKKIWNLFKTAENNYLQNQTSNDQRTFEVFGTGHNITVGMGIERKHISTIQDDSCVYHVFERIS